MKSKLMFKRIVALLLLICTQTSSLISQEKLTIEKVYRAKLRNSGVIIAGSEIKGYYMFYQSDKIDRHTNEYTLQIIDENLNKLKDIKLTDDKNIQLLESSFNGDGIMFLFYNSDDRMLTYRVYGTDGKQRFTYSKELDKKSKRYIESYQQFNTDDEAENQNLFDVEDRGFASIIPIRDGRDYSFEINYFATSKKKQWHYLPPDEGKVRTANFFGANDSLAFFQVIKKEKLMSSDMETFLLAMDIETGKKAFEIKLEDTKNILLPMNLSMLNGKNEYLLLGSYYSVADKIGKDKSKGLGLWVMNNRGEIKEKKYASLETDIAKFLPVDRKGKIDNFGYLYIHKIIQTEDGKVFAIGEGYRKKASAAGIAINALSLLGGGRSSVGVADMVVTDLALFQFDTRFNLENAKVYDKYNNVMNLGEMDFVNQHTLALMLKAMGAFDYSFTQTDKNKSSFYVGFVDYERSKEYKGGTFNSISYYNGNLTTDKVLLKSKASSQRVFPAKTGSIMIMEYYRKDKRLEFRLEKIN
jgi:hypothetical protein